MKGTTGHDDNNFTTENNTMAAKFNLGTVTATPAVLDCLSESGQTPGEFLARHQCGDWGDLDDEDKRLNDEALVDGSRILSAYKLATGQRIWIITEVGRTLTTILRPEDYR